MKYSGYLTIQLKEDGRESFHSNMIHQDSNHKYTVILYAKEGERAWIAINQPNDEITPWHRIHTSLVVKTTLADGYFIMETENSIYTLELD